MTLDTAPYMTFCDADLRRSLADKLALACIHKVLGEAPIHEHWNVAGLV